jgi:hypothetical protein
VAFRINWAISVGWDTSDAWLEGSEIVVAFICFANIRSRAGGITWSCSDTLSPFDRLTILPLINDNIMCEIFLTFSIIEQVRKTA